MSIIMILFEDRMCSLFWRTQALSKGSFAKETYSSHQYPIHIFAIERKWQENNDDDRRQDEALSKEP